MKFKRDRAYKMILRNARKLLKKKFYQFVNEKLVYKISDGELLEKVYEYLSREFTHAIVNK